MQMAEKKVRAHLSYTVPGYFPLVIKLKTGPLDNPAKMQLPAQIEVR